MENKRLLCYILIMRKNKGFTLIEVMICTGILITLFVSLISIYFYCFDMQENARNTSFVLNNARAKLEEIKNSNFDAIVTTYNGGVFFTTLPSGAMRTEATVVVGSNGNLIDLRIVACWRQRAGRIIGEDRDLDGQLDAGEDANGNGKLDSPVELNTSISKKENE